MTSWSSSRRASVRHLARSFHTLMRQSCEQLANNSSPPEGVIERTWKPSRDFIQSSAFDSDSNPLFSTLLNLILATSLSRTGRRWRSHYDSRRRLGAASQVENKAHDPVSEYPPICCMMHFNGLWPRLSQDKHDKKRSPSNGKRKWCNNLWHPLFRDNSYYLFISLT